MANDCFRGYASKDLAHAARCTSVAAGFKVWFDKTCLQPGYNRHEDIEEGYEKPRHIATVDAALEAIRVDAF